MADLMQLIADKANKYGIPVNVLTELVRAESSFNPNAKSGAGAMGLGQLMPACVTIDTKCLTINGWKNHDEISVGELILTYSIEKNIMEWQPVEVVFFYKNPGELIHMQNQCFDFIVTPNHKWVVRQDWNKKVLFKETSDLNVSSDNLIIRVADYLFPEEKVIPDEIVYLAGVVFADGTVTRNGKQIDLYQKDKVEKFRNILDRAGLKYREYPNRGGCCTYRWNITGENAYKIGRWVCVNGKKRLSMDLLLSITKEQAKLLWEALLDTDAYETCNGWQGFNQSDLDRVTDIQLLVYLLGNLSNVRKVRDKGTSNIRGKEVSIKKKYQATVKKRKTTCASNKKLKYRVVESMPVWCPSVKNKTWVALRDGYISITGNTARSLGVTNPYDPEQNLEGAAKYLSQQLKQFGSIPLALAAYNSGPGNVQKYGGIPPFAETQAYVQKIMGGLGQGGVAYNTPNTPTGAQKGPVNEGQAPGQGDRLSAFRTALENAFTPIETPEPSNIAAQSTQPIQTQSAQVPVDAVPGLTDDEINTLTKLFGGRAIIG